MLIANSEEALKAHDIENDMGLDKSSWSDDDDLDFMAD